MKCFSNLSRARKAAAIVALQILIACSSKEAPKTPLGAAQREQSGLVGDARVALDSANALFRAKAYDEALKQYERASELAPAETTPLLGVLMVADVTGNSELTNSALARLRKIDPSLADSSTANSHSKMMREHPKSPPPATSG